MTGTQPSASRRNGRLIAVLLTAVASVSLFTACAAGGGAAGSAGDSGAVDTAEAIAGTWGSTGDGQPHLIFSDGSVTGTDGCNGISTTYTVEGDTVTLDPFLSTLRACTGVDTWLRSVHSVTIDGDALIVTNAAGERIGSLDRNV